MRWVGKLHPLAVHFPIALVISAALAEILFWRTRRPLFSDAARCAVALGALSSLAAVVLGWMSAQFANYPGMDWVVTTHRWLGTGTALLLLITVYLSESSHRPGKVHLRRAYRVCLYASALLVAIVGHFGAALVFGLDYFIR